MPKKKKEGRPERFSYAKVADALRKSSGFKTVAAKRLGCTVSTIINYCRRHPKLQEVFDEAQEVTLDRAEACLQSFMFPPVGEDGLPLWKPSEMSVHFFLKTRGKCRGYVEQQEHKVDTRVKYEIQLPEDFPSEDYDDPEVIAANRNA